MIDWKEIVTASPGRGLKRTSRGQSGQFHQEVVQHTIVIDASIVIDAAIVISSLSVGPCTDPPVDSFKLVWPARHSLLFAPPNINPSPQGLSSG